MPGQVPEYIIESADLLLNGQYERDGFDLIITGGDGSVVVVADYFSFDPPPNLMLANGNGLSPEMVKSLLHDRIENTLFAGPAEGPAALQQIGVVRFASGNVLRKNAEGEEVLQKGDAIYQGDEIVIEGRGYVVATMNDGTRFTQGANSRATLDKFEFNETARTGTFEAKVLQGGFSYKSGKIGQFAGNVRDHTKISTPSAVIRVRGSELEGTVDATTGETIVVHKSGFLTVTDVNDNNPVILDTPNNSTMIISGGVPSGAGMASPAQLQAIQQALPPQQVVDQADQDVADQRQDDGPDDTEGETPPDDAPADDAPNPDAAQDGPPGEPGAEAEGEPGDEATEEEKAEAEADLEAQAKEGEGDGPDENQEENPEDKQSEAAGDRGAEGEGQGEADVKQGGARQAGAEDAGSTEEGDATAQDGAGTDEGTRSEEGANSADGSGPNTDSQGDDAATTAGDNAGNGSDNASGVPAQRSAPNTAFDANPEGGDTATPSLGTSSSGSNPGIGSGTNPTNTEQQTPIDNSLGNDPVGNEPPVANEPAPDNPPVANDDVVSLLEGESIELAALVLDNDDDPDANQSPNLSSVSVASTNGVVTLDAANQTLSYLAGDQFDALGTGETATDSFEYTVRSGQFTSTATVTLTVEGVNDLTVAEDDSYAIEEGENLVVDAAQGLLANDSDVDTNDTFAVVDATVTSEDATEVIFNSDGSFEFLSSTSDFLNQLGPGETFTSTIVYTVESSAGDTTTATASVLVTGANTAPTTVDDVAALTEAETVTILPLENDSDFDGDSLVLTNAVVTGGSGTVTITGGELLFTPTTNIAEGATLNDQIVYTVSDGTTTSNGTIALTITGVNDAPVVQPQAPEDIPQIAATSGPVDITNQVLAVVGDDSPGTEVTALDTTGTLSSVVLGSVILDATGAFDFLNLGETFFDSFGFTATDLQGLNTDGRFGVTIQGEADAPVVSGPLTFTQTEDDASLVIDLLSGATDVDATDVLSVTNLTSTGDDSGITINGSTLTLDPNAYNNLSVGASELITLTYDVTDTTGLSVSQTATITINGVNDAPVTTPATLNVVENGSVVNSNFAFFTVAPLAVDPDGDVLSIAAPGPVLISGNDIGSTISGTSISFDPGAYDSLGGSESEIIVYSYNVEDGNGGVAPGTFTITVAGVNDEPVTSNASLTTVEDTPTVLGIGNFAFSDIDANDVFQQVKIDVLPIRGQLQLNGVDVVAGQAIDVTAINGSQLSYSPAANGNGIAYDTLSFSVGDGTSFSSVSTLTIDVTAVNDIPTVVPGILTLSQNDAITDGNFLSNATDADGDTLTVANLILASGLGSGVTTSASPLFSVNPNFYASLDGGDFETIVYNYDVLDGNGGSTPGTFTITINGANDAPSTANSLIATSEDTPIVVTAADFPFTDSDSLDLLQQVRIDSLPGPGQLQLNGVNVSVGQLISIANINASLLSYIPGLNGSGAAYDSFSFAVSDGTDFSATRILTVDVTPVNDAPIANPDFYNVTFNTPFTAMLGVDELLINDSDPEGDFLMINTTAVVGPLQGIVTINSDSTFTYTPNNNAIGVDTFTYEVSDGNGGVTQAVATLTIGGVPAEAINSGDFSVPTNFLAGTVPIATDDLFVGTGVSLDITLGPVMLNSVETDGSGGQLNVIGTDLNLTDFALIPVSSGLAVTNGSVTAGGLVTIDGNLDLTTSDLTAMSFSNTGVVTVQSGVSSIDILGGSNDGQIDVLGVSGSATTELQFVNSFTNNNMITLNNTDASPRNVVISAPDGLTNLGTIETQFGSGGAKTIDASIFSTDAGTVTVGAGDLLNIVASTTELGSATVFNGAGDVRFDGTQTIDLISDFTVGSLTAPLDFDGLITITGTGTLIIDSGATQILRTDSVFTDINVLGTLVVQEGITIINSTSFSNTGTLEIRGVDGSTQSLLNLVQPFTNDGQIVLENASASSRNLEVDFNGTSLTNNGAIATSNTGGGGGGSLTLTGQTLDTSSGSLQTQAGRVLEVSTTTTQLGAGTVISGAGTVKFNGPQFLDLVSNFTIDGSTSELDLSGAITISGAGDLTILSGAELILTADTVSSVVVNQGDLVITSGTSTISNPGFNNTGTVHVRGTSVGSATLALLASVANAGTILLDNEFSSTRSLILDASGQTLTVTGSIQTDDTGGGGGTRTVMADALDISSGTLDVVSGGFLNLANTTTVVGTGTSLIGGGVVELTGTQTLSLASDFSIAPTTNFIDLSGVVTISGAGTLIIDSTAEFTIKTDTINSNINNDGTLIVLQGTNSINSINLVNTGTLSVRGNNASSVSLVVANGFTNAGTIELDNVFTSARAADLTVSTGVLFNTGTITTLDTGTGGGTRSITADVTNDVSGSILIAADTTLNSTTFDAQSGSIDVAVGNVFDIDATTTQLGTSTVLTGNGELSFSGTQLVEFVSAFTLLSTAPIIATPGTIDFGGAGNFTIDAGAGLTLTGDTLSASTNVLGDLVFENVNNQVNSAVFSSSGTVSVVATTAGSASVTFNNAFSQSGLVLLDNASTSTRSVVLNAPTGAFTNTGTIRALDSGGGVEGTRSIVANELDTSDGTIDVLGTIALVLGNDTTTVGMGTVFSGSGSLEFIGTQTLNLDTIFAVTPTTPFLDFSGNVTISGAGDLDILTSSELLLTNDTISADVNNQGDLIFENLGNQINSASFITTGSLLVRGTGGSSSDVTFANAFTNGGSISLDNTFTSPRTASLTVSTGVFTNNGSIFLVDSGGGGGIRNLVGDIANTGGITAASDANISGGIFNTIAGTVSVSPSVTLTIASGTTQLGITTTLSGNSGTLDFSGTQTVDITTAFTLDSGAPMIGTSGNIDFTGAGLFTIDAGTVLILTGDTLSADTVNNGFLEFENLGNQITSSTLTNNAAIMLRGTSAGAADLTVATGFVNSGQIVLDNNFTSSRSATFTVTSGTLTNSGSGVIQTMNSGTGGGLFTINADIQSAGLIDVDHDVTINSSVFDTESGSIDVANLVTLTIDATTTNVGAETTLQGSGIIELQGTQALTLVGNFSIGSGPLIDPVGDITINGPGLLNVAAGGTLKLTADVVNADLTNDDQVLIQEGTSNINSTSFVNNGMLSIEATAATGSVALDVLNTFTNNGTIELDNAFTSSRTVSFDTTSTTLTNLGLIRTANNGGGGGAFTISSDIVNQSTIQIDHDATIVGAQLETNMGTITVSGSNVLDLNVSTTQLTDMTTLDGTGTIKFLGTQILMFNTDFSFGLTNPNFDFAGDITFEGSASTVTIEAGEVITLDGDTVNTNLTISGELVAQSTTFINATTFTSDGVLRVEATDALAANVTVTPTFTNDGIIILDNPSSNNRLVDLSFTNSLFNNNQITVQNTGGGTGTFTLTAGGFDNNGTIDVNASLTIDSGGTGLNASGANINIAEGKTLALQVANYTNDGTITLLGGLTATTLDLSAVTTLTNNGTIAGIGNVVNGGVITGVGTLNVVPGASPGILSFDSDLNTAIDLEIELEGLTPGIGHDQFSIAGTANLDSSILDVILLNGYEPEVGDSYVVLTADAITGHFGEVTGLDISADRVLDLQYVGGDVTLTAVATTEVGTASNDSIHGSSQQDVIVAGDGDDLISTGAGADIIFGQAGDDVIEVEGDFNRVDGGSGIDELRVSDIGETDGKRVDNIEVLNIGDGNASLSAITVLEMSSDTNALTGVDDSLVVAGSNLGVVTLVGSFVYSSTEPLDLGSGVGLFDVYQDGDVSVYISQSILVGHQATQDSAQVGAPIDLGGVDQLAAESTTTGGTSDTMASTQIQDLGLADLFGNDDSLNDLLSQLPSETPDFEGSALLALNDSNTPGLTSEVLNGPTMVSIQDALLPLDQYSEL